jgi:hypothetical protein
MRKQLAPQHPEPPKSPTAEAVEISPDATANVIAESDDTAEKTTKSKSTAAVGVDKPHKPHAARLDPAVLELLRRCCGEECVARLLACHE